MRRSHTCSIIPDTKDFHAVVYWKGSLLSYDYIIATYTKNGVLINKKVIAGVRSDGINLKRSLATIDKDWIINVVVGEQSSDDDHYDPAHSQHMALELMATGEIIFSLQDLP